MAVNGKETTVKIKKTKRLLFVFVIKLFANCLVFIKKAAYICLLITKTKNNAIKV